ncbi:MAG: hypothetical protein ACRETO_09245 [Gammaproteobacteria bacterium]
MMRAIIKLLIVGVLFIYPFAIYFGDDYLTPSQFLAGLLLLLAGRVLIVAWIKAEYRKRNIAFAVLLLIAALAILLLLPDVKLMYLRLYPMLLNLLMFAIFFGSLFSSMPLAERLARFVHKELPAQAVLYTRRVTWTWSIVLLLNALVSLYTALAASFETWTLYNGIITYLLFGSVFVCEYALRTHLRRKWAAA